MPRDFDVKARANTSSLDSPGVTVDARFVQVSVAEYLVEARVPSSWPEAGPPEIAFAGRSNVGKSSLLNALAAKKGLARTSNTPGRTRGLVFFRLVASGHELRFVDLPGYGYAKVSQSERASWKRLIESYVADRAPLKIVLVLVDARRGLEPMDLELCRWLTSIGRRHLVVVTKADKLSPSARKPLVFRVAKEMKDLAGSQAPLLFSSVTLAGRTELWRVIASMARP